MAEKRYYWLKFKEDFFDFKGVKKLRKLAGGDTYVIIYLKMLLRSLKTDGVLEYCGIEDDFAKELALDLDEEVDNVRVVLTIITGCGMCEFYDENHIFLPYVGENTGSETASTQRWRDWKKRQNEMKALETNTVPTLPQRTANAEKEIENRDREKSKSKNTIAHPEVSVVSDFDAFWSVYPRKVGKGAARKSFEKAMKKTDLKTILDAVEAQRQSPQWTRDDGQFIPHPATWLNQERWADEVQTGDGLDNLRNLYAMFKEEEQ